MSLRRAPRPIWPRKKRWRWSTGWAARSAITRRVKASISTSAFSQSSQDISLSWQYALLLPPWVWPISSPPSSIGQPWERSSGGEQVAPLPVAERDHPASSVSPSTPWFQERLSSVPSRLSSPFASLCLPL